jgi:hypothetical protein
VAKGDRKSAFRSSLKEEEKAVQSRFERAETALAKGGKSGAAKGTGAAEEKKAVGKVIRDSFTMPEEDHALIERVRHLCLKKMMVVSKSEVLRVGVQLLNALSEKEIIERIKNLPKVKTGRPPIE